MKINRKTLHQTNANCIKCKKHLGVCALSVNILLLHIYTKCINRKAYLKSKISTRWLSIWNPQELLNLLVSPCGFRQRSHNLSLTRQTNHWIVGYNVIHVTKQNQYHRKDAHHGPNHVPSVVGKSSQTTDKLLVSLLAAVFYRKLSRTLDLNFISLDFREVRSHRHSSSSTVWSNVKRVFYENFDY